MKAGDKVYCIKDMMFHSSEKFSVKAGNYYIIESIRSPFYYSVLIKNEYNYYMQFSLMDVNNETLFSDHFITLSECRKLKLKNIGML